MKKKRLYRNTIWLVLLAVTLLLGCQHKVDYSFENPDIIAYVNGHPVYESKKKQYIEMKKAYYGAIVNSDKNNNSFDVSDLDPFSEMLNKTSEIKLDKMEQVISYSDQEWENDYYKTFIIEDRLYDFVNNKKDSFEDFTKNSVEASVKDALDSGGVESQYYNGASFKLQDIISSVAKKYDLSYEDCVNDIYRQFVKSDFQYEFLANYYAEREYKGNKVEWNGTNIKAYVEYLSDIYTKYDEYLDKHLEQAEIVNRK